MSKQFKSIAPYYDKLMENIDYEGWIKYVIDIGNLFDVKISPLLDITCGTGNSVIPFLNKDIEFVGVDNSLEMLKIARKKIPEKFFIQAEAQNLPFNSQFNLAISIFDSLNYILDYSDLVDSFRSVYSSLLEDGLFIFDVNTPYGLKTLSNRDTKDEEDDFISIWRNSYNKKTRIITLHLTLFVRKNNSWERIDEIHREKGYTTEEISDGLKEAGFELLGNFKCFEEAQVDRFTRRVLYVARR